MHPGVLYIYSVRLYIYIDCYAKFIVKKLQNKPKHTSMLQLEARIGDHNFGAPLGLGCSSKYAPKSSRNNNWYSLG
jgi:hypothetical protein